MKKKNVLFFSMLIAVGVITAWSCKKDDDKTVTKEEAIAVAKNDVTTDNIFDGLYNESEEILSDLENEKYPAATTKKSLSGISVMVTKNFGDSTTFPKEIKVVYSEYSTQGIKISGTLNITQSARIRKVGAIRTVTLDNIVINDTIKVEGKKTVTVKTPVDGKPSIQVELTNGKITFTKSGNYITRAFTRNLTWSAGYNTPFWIWDDIYTFTSTGNGSSKSGFSFTTNTSEALEYKLGDLCIKKGKIEIKVEDKTVYIDFNRTDCLNKIKLIIEGSTQEI